MTFSELKAYVEEAMIDVHCRRGHHEDTIDEVMAAIEQCRANANQYAVPMIRLEQLCKQWERPVRLHIRGASNPNMSLNIGGWKKGETFWAKSEDVSSAISFLASQAIEHINNKDQQ